MRDTDRQLCYLLVDRLRHQSGTLTTTTASSLLDTWGGAGTGARVIPLGQAVTSGGRGLWTVSGGTVAIVKGHTSRRTR